MWGGYSSEKEVSKKSAWNVKHHLEAVAYDITMVEISKEKWLSDQGEEINRSNFTLNGTPFDFAYIMVHGTPGEDGKLQAYFDMLEIPYAGCNHLISTITFNKWMCNNALRDLGFSCAKSLLLRKGMDINPLTIEKELGFPMFIKPNDGGSSFGVSKVKSQQEIRSAIQNAFKEGDEVIMESFMSGREFTCGAFYNGEKVVVLPVTEIIFNGDFFDYEAKYEGKSQEITPANLDKVNTGKIQEIVHQVYQTLGCKGFIRIDFILEQKGPSIIEINTIPGMTNASLIPQQVSAAGLSLSNSLKQIISDALSD